MCLSELHNKFGYCNCLFVLFLLFIFIIYIFRSVLSFIVIFNFCHN